MMDPVRHAARKLQIAIEAVVKRSSYNQLGICRAVKLTHGDNDEKQYGASVNALSQWTRQSDPKGICPFVHHFAQSKKLSADTSGNDGVVVFSFARSQRPQSFFRRFLFAHIRNSSPKQKKLRKAFALPSITTSFKIKKSKARSDTPATQSMPCRESSAPMPQASAARRPSAPREAVSPYRRP